MSKTIGQFGLGLTGSYSSDGDYAAGLRFSLGLGREPRTSTWLYSAQPMAGLGAASVRMFVDENANGRLDPGESPVNNAGFVVNGSRREVRTNEAGIAQLGRLPVAQYVDVSIDRSTLFDPQWEPFREGVSLVPRPGHVTQVDFPVQMTTEIDGTVYLWESDSDREIGGLTVELLDMDMTVIGQTTSAWDGFYIMPRVPSGQYYLRISPTQLKQLKLRHTGIRVLEVDANGAYISGVDMLVQSATSTSRSARNAALRQEVPAESEKERSWIGAQPAGNYTLQLMGASQEASVRAFIDGQGIAAHAAYFETRYQGKPWYSVIYGSYPSRQSAVRALAELPSSMKTASPWIRRFGDVRRVAK